MTKEAEDKWVDTIVRTASLRESFYKECTVRGPSLDAAVFFPSSYSSPCLMPSTQPGYYNGEGSGLRVARNLTYGGGAEAFFDLLEKWRKSGQMEGMELRTPAKAKM